MNRETWLDNACDQLDGAFFDVNGYELPKKMQVSCGFPHAATSKAIGQCWAPTASKDETTQMFVSPVLDEPIQVLGTLLHEMVHASVGCEAGHKGPFRKMAKEFGFVGKMTATQVTDGSELHAKLLTISSKLGDYPHAAMVKRTKSGKGGSGWLRMQSPEKEDYRVMISPKKLEEYGAPVDPWGNEMELVS